MRTDQNRQALSKRRHGLRPNNTLIFDFNLIFDRPRFRIYEERTIYRERRERCNNLISLSIYMSHGLGRQTESHYFGIITLCCRVTSAASFMYAYMSQNIRKRKERQKCWPRSESPGYRKERTKATLFSHELHFLLLGPIVSERQHWDGDIGNGGEGVKRGYAVRWKGGGWWGEFRQAMHITIYK